MGLMGKFFWILCVCILSLLVVTVNKSFPQYGEIFAILVLLIIFSPWYFSWILKFLDIITRKKDTE
jgi:flagellar biosynthesis protein FliQ